MIVSIFMKNESDYTYHNIDNTFILTIYDVYNNNYIFLEQTRLMKLL